MSGGRTLRICSLLPSATEIVAALGELERLVGHSAECDFPPSVSHLPVVTSARVDTSALAIDAIDAAVRAAVAEGRSLYAVDSELVRELAPDLILTQDLCQVCAVSSRDETLCALELETLSLDTHSIGEISESIIRLAARLNVAERGRAVVETMKNTIGATPRARAGLNAAASSSASGSSRRSPPATGCQRWSRPPAA